MPAAFDYAVFRIVPRVERGEFVNVGVVLACPAAAFLGCRVTDDLSRLRALDPAVDCDFLRGHLDALVRVCDGDPEGGAVAALDARERFHWLTHPRSTVVQVSEVHSGATEDPAATLDRLFSTLVG